MARLPKLNKFYRPEYRERLLLALEDATKHSFKIQNYDLNEEDRFQVAAIYFQHHEIDNSFNLSVDRLYQVRFQIAATGNIYPFCFDETFSLEEHDQWQASFLSLLKESPWRSKAQGIWDEVAKIPVPSDRKAVLDFLIYFMVQNRRTNRIDENHWAVTSGWIEQLCRIRSPQVRMAALGSLALLCCREAKAPPISDRLLKTEAGLGLALVAANMRANGFDVTSLFDRFNKRIVSDNRVLIEWVEVLLLIDSKKVLSQECKRYLIDFLFSDINELQSNLKTVLIILNLSNELELTLEVLREKEIRGFVVELIRNELGDIPDVDRLLAIVSSWRVENAFITYIGTLKRLGDPEMKRGIGQFARALVDGNLEEIRYSTEHLQKLDPKLVDEWKKKVGPFPIEESSAEGEGKLDLKEWLRVKLIQDRHVDPSQIPFLIRFLLGDQRVYEELENALEVSPDEGTLLLEKKCIQIATSSLEGAPPLLRELEQLVKSQVGRGDFYYDVVALQRQLLSKTIDLKELTIVKTGDPENLLLCGTEVDGSCQRVNGEPQNCKGLLGYLLHGQTELIAAQNKQGKIVARALLRLLIDEKGAPVLFLERIYNNYNDERVGSAIKSFACRISNELQLPLTTNDEYIEDVYGEISSFGGSAPFEYSDGAGGVREKGIFTISDSKILYNPSGAF